VEKARGIYENLVAEDEVTEDEILDEKKEEVDEDSEKVDEEAKDEDKEDKEVDEAIRRNPEADFIDDASQPVSNDIEEIESEEMYSEDGEDEEMPMDMEIDPEGEPEGDTGDPEVDQAFVDAEEALDRLKAEFMELIGGEEEPVDDEMPMDMEPEMEPEVEGQQFESKVKDTVEEDFEEIEEAASMNSVANPSNTDTASNKKSPVAGKNDMGGTAVKVNDGSEGDHGAPSVSEDSAGNVNVPGGKAGKSQSDVSAPGNSEGADNKTSPIGS